MPPELRPVLCLVTDRQRLVRRLESPAIAWQSLLLEQVRGATRGGIDVVQIRERDLDAGELAPFVRQCLAIAAGTPTRIVVNDRLDVVIATGADGLHLREDSLPSAAARGMLAAGALLGRSVHRSDDVAAAGSVDYLIAGSVFASPSKPDAASRLGLDGFRAVVTRAAPRPVWAIGGITVARVPELMAAGAQGLAAISAFIPACDPSQLAAAVQKIAAEWRFCFDRSGGVP